jgi:hypothetical protein
MVGRGAGRCENRPPKRAEYPNRAVPHQQSGPKLQSMRLPLSVTKGAPAGGNRSRAVAPSAFLVDQATPTPPRTNNRPAYLGVIELKAFDG